MPGPRGGSGCAYRLEGDVDVEGAGSAGIGSAGAITYRIAKTVTITVVIPSAVANGHHDPDRWSRKAGAWETGGVAGSGTPLWPPSLLVGRLRRRLTGPSLQEVHRVSRGRYQLVVTLSDRGAARADRTRRGSAVRLPITAAVDPLGRGLEQPASSVLGVLAMSAFTVGGLGLLQADVASRTAIVSRPRRPGRDRAGAGRVP